MRLRQTIDLINAVCSSGRNRRILKYDHSGRSFQSGLRFRVLPFRRPTGVLELSVLSDLKVGESGGGEEEDRGNTKEEFHGESWSDNPA